MPSGLRFIVCKSISEFFRFPATAFVLTADRFSRIQSLGGAFFLNPSAVDFLGFKVFAAVVQFGVSASNPARNVPIVGEVDRLTLGEDAPSSIQLVSTLFKGASLFASSLDMPLGVRLTIVFFNRSAVPV